MTFHDGPNPRKPYTDPALQLKRDIDRAPTWNHEPINEIPPLSEVEWAWVIAIGFLFTAGVIVFLALGGCKVIAL